MCVCVCVCVCLCVSAHTCGFEQPDLADNPEKTFYYIHYAVPYHVIAKIISSLTYIHGFPFEFFIQFMFPSLLTFLLVKTLF